MHIKKMLIAFIFVSLNTISSDHVDLTHLSTKAQDSQESTELATYAAFSLKDIPWTVSREASEVNNDSFCCSVISYFDPTDGEMLDERNMMGNEE